jgi:hypothetical protein
MSSTKQLVKDDVRAVPKADWQGAMDKLVTVGSPNARGAAPAEDTEKPFGILALAWMLLITGAFLLVVGMARLTGQLGSAGAFAILAVGGVELVAGIALAYGSHVAYRVMLIVIPANFIANTALYVTTSDRQLLLGAAAFGFATFVLYGPGGYPTASRARRRVWLRGPVTPAHA